MGKLKNDRTSSAKGKMSTKQIKIRAGIGNGIITRGRGQDGSIPPIEKSSEEMKQKGSGGCTKTTTQDQ